LALSSTVLSSGAAPLRSRSRSGARPILDQLSNRMRFADLFSKQTREEICCRAGRERHHEFNCPAIWAWAAKPNSAQDAMVTANRRSISNLA
jgi:hypothetical protein